MASVFFHEEQHSHSSGSGIFRSGGVLQPSDRSSECRVGAPACHRSEYVDLDAKAVKYTLEIGEPLADAPSSASKLRLAQDTRTGRKYVLKARQVKDVTSRTAQERPADGLVPQERHPFLVEFSQAWQDISKFSGFLVMEYCAGGDLLVFIRARRRQAETDGRLYQCPEQAEDFVAQLFLGLEHMYLKGGLLHGNIKPGHVLMTAGGNVKLADFRLARLVSDTDSDYAPGSPGYAAPEVLRRQRRGASADLYSLGVLAWVLFTGGVATQVEPQPPMGKMRHMTDDQAHFSDWSLLADCLRDFGRRHEHLARCGEARDLVSALTLREPEDRLGHKDVREHDFMTELELPDFGSSHESVTEWAASMCLRMEEEAIKRNVSSTFDFQHVTEESSMTSDLDFLR